MQVHNHFYCVHLLYWHEKVKNNIFEVVHIIHCIGDISQIKNELILLSLK